MADLGKCSCKASVSQGVQQVGEVGKQEQVHKIVTSVDHKTSGGIGPEAHQAQHQTNDKDLHHGRRETIMGVANGEEEAGEHQAKTGLQGPSEEQFLPDAG